MGGTESWTIGRLLEWTTRYFQEHGSSTPRLDAEILLAHSLGCPRIILYTRFDEEIGEQPRAVFRELVKKRARGVPVAYLVGYREFFSLRFVVTPAVLIPRPETEFVVVAALEAAKRRLEDGESQTVRICDIGTGSGVLAVCLAKHLPQAEVTAVDLSSEALEIARQNAEAHGVAERIRFLKSDLLAAIDSGDRFDLAVSNPPYVRESELDSLPTEVRDYEPRIALVSGPDGTEIIARLLDTLPEYLEADGEFFCEISPMICDRVELLVRDHPHWELVRVIPDLARLPRVIHARKVG
ncbi:peptide chain release factor N(5)-glutamine methyltransferase [Thermostilla marina]